MKKEIILFSVSKKKFCFFFDYCDALFEPLKNGKTPRIFLPWCFAVQAAYSVVIILPLILHAFRAAFLSEKWKVESVKLRKISSPKARKLLIIE